MQLKLLGLSILLACSAMQAQAVGRLADVTVVDRATGAVLPVHYFGGEYWVAGRPGAKYAIAVRNRMGERVMAVTSVDGVNVLSGETAAWDQTGYVFGGSQRYQITGWRKSDSEVAAFEFSDASDSYAGRTGRPGNVGVIGVALFREKLPEPVVRAPQPFQRSDNESDSGRPRPANGPILEQRSAAPASSGANASDMADRRMESQALPSSALSFPERREKSADAAPVAKLGTAHGQRETSVVSNTFFERLQAQPNEVIRIRYDSRENLIATGVIREPVAQLPNRGANPFPLSGQATHVPDPPERRY